MLVVTRYRVPESEQDEFADAAGAALRALVACPGARSAHLGRALDDPELFTLTTRWENVGSYRRALSSYDVKLRAVPLMYRCLDEPSAFEELLTWEPAEGIREHPGDRA